MASIKQNKKLWGKQYNWKSCGDEWSVLWGGSDMQWFGTILPRIQQYVPSANVLEIAPGFGRWTKYLYILSQRLILVDVAKKCIEHCKKRFVSENHIDYHVNDGKSLEMVKNDSLDFVFSYDSLVHAEIDVMEAYVEQLSRKLSQNGIAFLHHSNIGEYENRTVEIINSGQDHGRAFSVTAGNVMHYIDKMGLKCISQETLNWGPELMTDCITVFTKQDSVFNRPCQTLENHNFMLEANRISELSTLYGANSFPKKFGS